MVKAKCPKVFVNVIKGSLTSYIKSPYKSWGEITNMWWTRKGMKREFTKEKIQIASEFFKATFPNQSSLIIAYTIG